MKPVLFELGGVPVSSYGASKALAILAAIWILARELRRVDLSPDLAYPLVLAGAAGGFLGAKLYYLAEHADSLTLHFPSAGPDSPGTAASSAERWRSSP